MIMDESIDIDGPWKIFKWIYAWSTKIKNM
jgi:hypothetical protein